MDSKTVNKFSGSLLMFGVALSGNASAHTTTIENTKQHALFIKHGKEKTTSTGTQKNSKPNLSAPQGWQLKSAGGLSYLNTNDDSVWFKLSGAIRFDETLFMGSYKDKQNDFPSGASLRTADLYLDGGLAKDWSYTLQLGFTGNSVNFGDVWLSYSGFLPNNQVFIGKVPGNWFGLDGSNSTSWNPFLERSLQTLAFYPADGLGVMTDFWWDIGGVTLTAMQPDQGESSDLAGVRDRWKGTIRATLAPIHEHGDVWHFGVSGAYREVVSSYQGNAKGTQFKTRPSARNRNTASLLDTSMIQANNSRLLNVEFARQYGAFMLEGEYTYATVHRVGLNNTTVTPQVPRTQGDVNFNGWNLQTRYVLTGEVHEYDVRDGGFGSLKPKASYGAVEVAARYDFLDLNNKDVRGGSEHNVTLGVNWYISQQVRLSANYIRASIHPAQDKTKRNLDIIGLRCQLRFK